MEQYNDKTAYAGVGWFKLPASHFLNKAGWWHDSWYEEAEAETTIDGDRTFFHIGLQEGLNRLSLSEDGDPFGDPFPSPLACTWVFAQTLAAYSLTRIWGTGRYWYAKAKGWDMLLGGE